MHVWQVLAERLLAGFGDEVEARGCPAWVRVFDDPAEPAGPVQREGSIRAEVSWSEGHPLGWHAPPGCAAVGAVATGRLVGEDGIAVRDHGTDPPRTAVRLSCLVSRWGDVGWMLEMPGGGQNVEPPSEGRMLDAFRRCFSLPTPPPPAPASELHDAAWLASLIEAGRGRRRPMSWGEVSRLHPLARALCGDLDGPAPRTGAREDLLGIAAAAMSWSEIRARAAAGGLPGLADGPIASWMDDGMFARHVLGSLPPVDALLDQVRPVLAPSAAHRLEESIRRRRETPQTIR